jgi:hypothetical protein
LSSSLSQNHHAIVVGPNAEFKGLVSSWDITVECARDDRAWPWNRPEDGRFHKANEHELGASPTTPVDEAHISNVRASGERPSHLGDSFRAYIDNLGYFD